MKKNIFSLAIIAIMALLMSCGNSGEKSTRDMWTSANENNPSNFIENEYLTATLPDGWEKIHVYDRGFSAELKNEDGDGDKVAIVFKAFDTNFDLKGWVDHRKEEGSITDKIEDVNIGGITFQKYAYIEHPSMPYIYFVSYSNKRQYRFEIHIYNKDAENEPSVKQLLDSVKFK